MNTSLDVIRAAIYERRQLEFIYKGLRRVTEPMALGAGQKARWQLRAQQIGGLSSSGSVGAGDPKLFDVALMSRIELLAATFDVPEGYQLNDKAFIQIDTQLGGRPDVSSIV